MEDIQIVKKILQKIEEIIFDFFTNNSDNKPEVSLNSNLRDQLRLDELALIELALWLEHEFQIEIHDENIEQFLKVHDIIKYVQA